jgi:hypothetical protein
MESVRPRSTSERMSAARISSEVLVCKTVDMSKINQATAGVEAKQ